MAKLTPEVLESKIKSEAYHQFADTTVTVCCLTLDNDFSVIGHSACIDNESFDAELGKEYSRADAFAKMWGLYGFEAKSALVK